MAMNTAAFTGEYSTEFSITGPDQDESPLFGRVRDLVLSQFESLQGDREFAEESGEFEELSYQRFQIELPHGRNPDFQVRLNVKLSTRGGPMTVAVQSEFTDMDNPVPPELVAGPPRLGLELFKAFECYNGPDRLSAIPVRLAPENAEDFAIRIFNLDRRLPILAVSENWRRQTPANPNWLQQLLAGVAEVVTYNGDTADELRRHTGFELACFNGAMRIYQPGCSRDDRREQHKFWMPSDAGALLRRPAGIVVREFARHLPEFTETREFESVRGQVQQRRIAELAAERLAFPLRQRIGELESEITSLRQELQERERDTATGLAELHNLRQQLLNRDSELNSLRGQVQQAIHREAEYEPEIARLHQQQTERDERIEALRQQLESAISQAGVGQSEVTQLHNQLLERDSQLESLRQELDKAVHRGAESEQEIVLLNALIQESDTEVEALRQQLDDAVGASREAIEQLNASLQERDSELNILRAQLEDAHNRSKEIGNLIAELNKELEIRDTDITNLRLLLEGIEEGSADSDKVIAELRHELLEREEDARAISELLEKARSRADAAENAVWELRRELEQHLAESHVIGDIIKESRNDASDARDKAAQANKATAELIQQIGTLNDQVATLRQQLTKAQNEASDHLQNYEDLETRYKDLEDKFRRFRYQSGPWYYPDPEEAEDHEEPPEINTVEDAVVTAYQLFDRLQFLGTAFDSANNYPYRRPVKVYEAFSLLQEVAIARSKGPLGKSVEDWLRERGCDYAPYESEATMNEHGPTRWFHGLEMQEHIKFGSHTADQQHYIRIHFCWEAESAQYIIGHVGEHLPTVSD